MTANAREALRHFTAALEAHLEAVEQRRSAEDAAVDDAFYAVAEAYERYDEALDAEHGESLPLMLEDDLDDDDDDDDAFDDEALDPHADENEDDLDDDIEEFDLR